jgi:putative PIN family toxin of toxin-antitoxin system
MAIEPPSIVIDANVLISAGILPQSRLAQVLVVAVGRFVIAQNTATWNELITRIERDKFDRYFGEHGRLAYLSRLAQVVRFFEPVANERVSRDPDDDKYLSLALDSGAKLMVSGDGDLKDIQTHKGVEIMSPSEFLRRWTG